MLKKLWRKLFPPTVVFIEVPPDRQGERTQVPNLANHDGFLWLMWKLRLQRSVLAAELENAKLSHEDDIFMKAGIYWLRFMETSLKTELSRPTRKQTKADLDDELTKQIFAAISGVGEDTPQA